MRSVIVKTSCGCAMPGIAAALDREQFEKAAEAQLAKGRKRPVTTKVGRYVLAHAPKLSRKLNKILRKYSKIVSERATDRWGKQVAKADNPDDLDKFINDALTDEALAQLADELGISDMTDALRDALIEQIKQAYSTAVDIGVTEAGFSTTDAMDRVAGGLPPITEQVDQMAVDYASERGGELIKDLAGTTIDDLRDVLSGAVEDGVSPSDLSDAIQAMGGFSESRADMIARTELANAHVSGNVDGWRETGLVEGKRSILGDLHDIDDQCDDCADAGVVALDDEFAPGYTQPPYHPNCICDVEPVRVMDDGEDQSDSEEES